MVMRLDYLQLAHRNHNLIPVVGAGYSAAVAGLPSWPGLVTRGVEYSRANLSKQVSLRQLRALESMAATGDLLTAFSSLQQLLAQDSQEHYESLHYQGFLNDVFHAINPASSSLSDALRSLSPRVILTTNYDTLLEEAEITSGTQSVTWLEPGKIRSLLRSDSGVVHLHGRYDVSSSVILSRSDYQRIVDDRDAAVVAQAAFNAGVLLFIASSVGGLGDPHMSRILTEFASMSDRSQGEQSPHIALVQGRLPGEDIARMRRLGIEAISYGESYSDLPGFLHKIVERERITVGSHTLRSLSEALGKAETKDTALGLIADFVRQEVYRGRDTRITFCEKVVDDSAAHLEARYVMPANATRNIFNYPLSIASWALIEGRIISWPEERATRCNLDLVERLGRYDDVWKLLSSQAVESVPEISRYVDLERVRTLFLERQLTLGDFFQDWTAGQPFPRYDQFISVPVPCIESFGNREKIPEFGVFNIDTLGGGPLIDRRTSELLQLAASLATLVYLRLQ